MRTNSIGRRQPDPLPLTWEVPAGLALTWVCLAGAALLAGQATAGLVTGAGWLWPDSTHLLAAAGGLLTGHVGTGVSPSPPAPGATATLPAAWLVYGLIGLYQLLLLAMSGWAGVQFWTRVGPGRRYGMATRVEAQTVLGVGRLRRVRKIIRPDLYGTAGQRGSALTARGRRTPPTTQATVDAVNSTDATQDDATTTAAANPDSPKAGRDRKARFAPQTVGWRLGAGQLPRCGDLWVPYDRTAGVYGPQGSGKTLDLLTPALLAAPGAALVTLTKADGC